MPFKICGKHNTTYNVSIGCNRCNKIINREKSDKIKRKNFRDREREKEKRKTHVEEIKKYFKSEEFIEKAKEVKEIMIDKRIRIMAASREVFGCNRSKVFILRIKQANNINEITDFYDAYGIKCDYTKKKSRKIKNYFNRFNHSGIFVEKVKR